MTTIFNLYQATLTDQSIKYARNYQIYHVYDHSQHNSVNDGDLFGNDIGDCYGNGCGGGHGLGNTYRIDQYTFGEGEGSTNGNSTGFGIGIGLGDDIGDNDSIIDLIWDW